MNKAKKVGEKLALNAVIVAFLFVLPICFLYPLFFILLNSFKGKLFISKNRFALPTAETFSGISNYVNGIIR